MDTPDNDGGKAASAALVRDLVRLAWKATLGTLSRTDGSPYASLVAPATEPDGRPILLLSGLAEHTKNLLADQRASLLIDGTPPNRAALTGARVTLVGRLREAASDTARRRYLARHPDAIQFIDFPDFKLFALDVEWAHLVAGFGRIVRLDKSDVLISTTDASRLIEAEPDIIEHMNADHQDAVAHIAKAQIPPDPQPTDSAASWRMIGCDPEGIDLTDGERALRRRFSKRVVTPDDARDEIVRLVRRVHGG